MKRYYTNAKDSEVFEHPDGPFVLYAEHAAALKEHLAALQDYFDNDENSDTWRALNARIARYESALTLLANGFKYSTEVVTIAREALSSCQPGYVEEQRGGATIRHSESETKDVPRPVLYVKHPDGSYSEYTK
jgi:hypothetical protein